VRVWAWMALVFVEKSVSDVRRARTGLRDYIHQLKYIGDTKAGEYKGADECVSLRYYMRLSTAVILNRRPNRLGNKYYENLNPFEENPGRHRWVDYAKVSVLFPFFVCFSC
jgi:NADH dehydrogenase (ubiquinone) 1 alpha subcomplex subunit 12